MDVFLKGITDYIVKPFFADSGLLGSMVVWVLKLDRKIIFKHEELLICLYCLYFRSNLSMFLDSNKLQWGLWVDSVITFAYKINDITLSSFLWIFWKNNLRFIIYFLRIYCCRKELTKQKIKKFCREKRSRLISRKLVKLVLVLRKL